LSIIGLPVRNTNRPRIVAELAQRAVASVLSRWRGAETLTRGLIPTPSRRSYEPLPAVGGSMKIGWSLPQLAGSGIEAPSQVCGLIFST
jgi:hypothetical protein